MSNNLKKVGSLKVILWDTLVTFVAAVGVPSLSLDIPHAHTNYT